MPWKKTATLAIPVALTLSACQANEAETAFVKQCQTNFGDKATEAICSCVHKGLKAEFSEPQMTRIAGLFSMTISQGADVLKSSGTADDVKILERLSDIEVVTETCFAQAQ